MASLLGGRLAKPGERGSPAAGHGGGISETLDPPIPGQQRSDPGALHASAAAMNEAYFSEPCLEGRVQVGIHHFGNL